MKAKLKLWTGWDSVRRLVRNILATPQKQKWLEMSARIHELREQRDVSSRIGEYALARKFSDDMTAAQLERDAVYFPNVPSDLSLLAFGTVPGREADQQELCRKSRRDRD